MGRLEELSEARQSVVSKVKAAERDRDSLQGAKTVAEAYLGKERECALAHASLYQIFLRDGQVRAARPGSLTHASALSLVTVSAVKAAVRTEGSVRAWSSPIVEEVKT